MEFQTAAMVVTGALSTIGILSAKVRQVFNACFSIVFKKILINDENRFINMAHANGYKVLLHAEEELINDCIVKKPIMVFIHRGFFDFAWILSTTRNKKDSSGSEFTYTESHAYWVRRFFDIKSVMNNIGEQYMLTNKSGIHCIFNGRAVTAARDTRFKTSNTTRFNGKWAELISCEIEALYEKAARNEYIYPKGVARIFDDIAQWNSRLREDAEHGIPHVMGILAYGLPGTGKSLLAVDIANRFKFKLVEVDLSSMDDKWSFDNAATSIHRPTVFVFNEIDLFYNKDRQIIMNGLMPATKLPFEAILNLLNGSSTVNNAIYLFTTNRIGEIHESFGLPVNPIKNGISTTTRPSRISHAIWLDNYDAETAAQIALAYAQGNQEIADRYMSSYEPTTPDIIRENVRQMLFASRVTPK